MLLNLVLHPFCHKKGIIYNFIDRSVLLSHPKFLEKNISLVINILLNNGYPLDLIFSTINQRLKHLIATKLNSSSSNNMLTQSTETVGKKEGKKFFVIPYINGKIISDKIASVINKSEMILGYRCLNNLSKIIRVYKDKNQLTNNSNVIYKVSCHDCDATYIGQTKRQLNTRLKEHVNNIKLDIFILN